MSKRTIFAIAAAFIAVVAWWSYRHGSSSNASPGNATGRRSGGGVAVPVVAGKAEQKDVPVYLDGLAIPSSSYRSLMDETTTVEARL
jgi:hypothetical protein